MDVSADTYDNSNNVQLSNGIKLLDKIRTENIDKKYEIVLDIGCGSGNTTVLLKSSLDINQLYAIDINESMIEFAEQNHQKIGITYLSQDISLEWDQLSPKLKALEGNVSLIYSNHCLHWIKNTENMAKNLFRLLSKCGKIYAIINLITDPYSDLTGEEKERHELEFMSVPNSEIQHKAWNETFRSVGFTINSNEIIEKKANYELKCFEENVLPMILSCFKMFFSAGDVHNFEKNLSQKYLSQFYRYFDETTGLAMIEINYSVFQLVIAKK